jgi:hypothetical protein
MTAGPLTLDRSFDRATNRRSLRSVFLFAAVTSAMAPVGYMSMLSGFREYDDEGYMLVTVSDYLAGHAIVTPPYVQLYGPFFYEVMGGVFRLLGLQPGHDSGRVITLAVWLIACLLGGVAGYRLTRNLWLGIGAQLVSFIVLTPLVGEPFTAPGLISLLVLAAAVAATFVPAKPRASAAVIGGIVAALCLVKINIGGFVAIAVLFAWAVGSPPGRRRWLAPAAALLVVVLPPALMAGMLSREWAQEFASVVSLSAASAGIVWLAARSRAFPAAPGWWLAAGGTAVLAVCLGIALAGGNGAAQLWDGLVVSSVKFPGIFVLPAGVQPISVYWAALAFAVAIGVSTRYAAAAAHPAFGIFRVLVGAVTWLVVLRQPTSLFLLVLPLAWLAAVPLQKVSTDSAGGYARAFLPMLAVMGSLQAYPVAGTQLAVASSALVPVGAIILNDGIRQLRSAGVPRALREIARWVAPGELLVNVAAFGFVALAATQLFQSETPLALPGSQALRVSRAEAVDLRSLVAAIDRQCSSFITFPGMDSLYVWTDQEPPTDMRYGLWWLSLDSSHQETIVQQLQNQSRLCVVKNQSVNDFWAQGRPIPQRPLVTFIDQNFVDAGSFGDYQLLVRPS